MWRFHLISHIRVPDRGGSGVRIIQSGPIHHHNGLLNPGLVGTIGNLPGFSHACFRRRLVAGLDAVIVLASIGCPLRSGNSGENLFYLPSREPLFQQKIPSSLLQGYWWERIRRVVRHKDSRSMEGVCKPRNIIGDLPRLAIWAGAIFPGLPLFCPTLGVKAMVFQHCTPCRGSLLPAAY